MEIWAGWRSTKAFRLSNLAVRGTLETGGKSVVDSSEVKREDGILQGAPALYGCASTLECGVVMWIPPYNDTCPHCGTVGKIRRLVIGQNADGHCFIVDAGQYNAVEK